MTLNEAEAGKEYVISSVDVNDSELGSFLFSLGCYSGEHVTLVSRKKHSLVLAIKDGRYNIDPELASAIRI